MCDQQSLRPACAYAQPDQSLCLSLEYSMIVKLLTERHLEFLSITGGCRGPSESTLVKTSNCWKSRALAPDSFLQLYRCWQQASIFWLSFFGEKQWQKTLASVPEEMVPTHQYDRFLTLNVWLDTYMFFWSNILFANSQQRLCLVRIFAGQHYDKCVDPMCCSKLFPAFGNYLRYILFTFVKHIEM